MTHRSAIAGQGGGDASWWLLDGGIAPSSVICVYVPVGAASYPASLVNLASPGDGDAVAIVAPSWSAGAGWVFDGATTASRLTGPAMPAQRDITLIVRGWTTATGAANQMLAGNGLLGAPGAVTISPRKTTPIREYRNGTNITISGYHAADGTMCVSGDSCYLNGLPDATISGAVSWSGGTLQIGGVISGGSLLIGSVLAMACYSVAMTADQVADLHAYMMELSA